jgi:DNA polymerase-3 subunit beta
VNITVQRDVLLHALQQVIGAIERRQTLPILGNFLFEVKGELLKITATDLEIELINEIPIDKVMSEGNTTLPARKFLDICRSLPDGCEISIHTEDEQVIIQAERSRFSLTTLPFVDFPRVDCLRDPEIIIFEQNKLRNLIQNVSFAMAQQDVRYYLNGMLLEVDSTGLCAATTDGHRLALCKVLFESDVNEIKQIIIPRKGILEIQRLLSDENLPIHIEIDSNHIRIDIGDIRLTSKIIDGKFPDYKRVIPHNNDKFVKINRELFKQALTRSAIISNEKFKGARFVINNNMISIETKNNDNENSKEEIVVEYNGDELIIGFNIIYLLDILNCIKDEYISFEFRTADTSCLIRYTDKFGLQCTYVVMPMRI